MGPVGRVVVVLADLVDLLLRLDVPVLRRPDVDTHVVAAYRVQVDSRALDGFVGAVDRDRTSARAASQALAALVALVVEVALPGNGLAEVANLVG